MVRGYLYPSVLPSPGVFPQNRRAAHGRRHLAVRSLLRLCWRHAWFFVRYFRDWCWLFSVVFSSLGSQAMFGLVPFKTRPVVADMFVDFSLSLSLSLSFSLVCSLTPFFLLFFFLSLSLSQRRWGNAGPFVVCVSPSVSTSWPCSLTSTRTSCSATTSRSGSCACVFLTTSFVFPVVVGLGPFWVCWGCGLFRLRCV